jgi:hypothetical protein
MERKMAIMKKKMKNVTVKSSADNKSTYNDEATNAEIIEVKTNDGKLSKPKKKVTANIKIPKNKKNKYANYKSNEMNVLK